jgi:hypothetical protein
MLSEFQVYVFFSLMICGRRIRSQRHLMDSKIVLTATRSNMNAGTTQNTMERHFQPEQGHCSHLEAEPLLLLSPCPKRNHIQVWLLRSNKDT